MIGDGEKPNMRLSASEKLEIIRLVEQSHLLARRRLEMLGIKPATFYRWYDRFQSGGSSNHWKFHCTAIRHSHAALTKTRDNPSNTLPN